MCIVECSTYIPRYLVCSFCHRSRRSFQAPDSRDTGKRTCLGYPHRRLRSGTDSTNTRSNLSKTKYKCSQIEPLSFERLFCVESSHVQSRIPHALCQETAVHVQNSFEVLMPQRHLFVQKARFSNSSRRDVLLPNMYSLLQMNSLKVSSCCTRSWVRSTVIRFTWYG